MSWYPSDMQHRDPSVVVKTFRKMSATVRWALLVLVAGLALAAIVGIAVTTLFTAIENGL